MHHARASAPDDRDPDADGLHAFNLGMVPASVTPPRTWRHAAWFAITASAASLGGLLVATTMLVGGGHTIDGLQLPSMPRGGEYPPLLRRTDAPTPPAAPDSSDRAPAAVRGESAGPSRGPVPAPPATSRPPGTATTPSPAPPPPAVPPPAPSPAATAPAPPSATTAPPDREPLIEPLPSPLTAEPAEPTATSPQPPGSAAQQYLDEITREELHRFCDQARRGQHSWPFADRCPEATGAPPGTARTAT
ncbi:hypothetical protein [Saccharopolyspora sp. CA-218241]|uniref:hypothetical protein n=1 Tax=Saccharopolyspora sp. CA-218241 TaxID=3240027 RepID=UPI003D95CE21